MLASAVCGHFPVPSSHLDGVDSEYIVRSGHSVQSNSYAIEEVRRILLLHAIDACTRIAAAGRSRGLLSRRGP